MGLCIHFFVPMKAQLCIYRNKYLITFIAFQSQAHGGAECPEFMGWALAHIDKASKATYDPSNPSSASEYNNPSFHSHISAYTKVGRQVHGQEWDPNAHPLDGEVIMRAGGDKKHGRLIIGDDTVDTASTPTLSQIRARDTPIALPIRPRLSIAQLQVEQIQVISASFLNPSIPNHTFTLITFSHWDETL